MIMMTDASVRWEGALRGAEPGRQTAYSDGPPVRKLEWESKISVITVHCRWMRSYCVAALRLIT